MSRIRALIVDDEPPARQRIRTLLEQRDDIEIVAECTDGNEALNVIRSRRPDLVFLDIQMPEMTGFEVVAAIGVERMPAVIFVTAFDRYAIKAFDVNAVDYLLKPFDRERFDTALGRAMETIRHRSAANPPLTKLIARLRKDDRIPDRLLIRSAGRMTAVRIDEIEWIEAAGNYVSIHTAAQTHLHRETLKNLQSTLDPSRFVRVHRSAIVNIAHVREVRPRQSGDSDIELDSGRVVSLSRRYREALDRALKLRS